MPRVYDLSSDRLINYEPYGHHHQSDNGEIPPDAGCDEEDRGSAKHLAHESNEVHDEVRYPVHGPLNLVCQVVEVWIVKLADRYSIECEDELLLHFRGEVIEKIPVRKFRQYVV